VTALWRDAAILVVAAGVSRLPQLTSPHLLLDGDEAILGLMAKHLAEGREAPVFFYGQAYGLSFFEAAAGAIAFRLAGVGDVQLKLAMLAIWLVGVVAGFIALGRILGPRRSFWAALLFVMLPAWAVWSMKARGGYLTAFAATSLLWNVLVSLRDRPRAASWTVAGVITALIFLAQRLWLPGVLPIAGWLLVRQRRLFFGLSYAAGVAAVFGLVIALTGLSLPMLTEGPRGRNVDLWRSLPFYLEQIYVHFTGFYYLWTTIGPGPLTALVAWLWCGLLVAMMVVQACRLAFRQFLMPSHVLCLSVLSTLAATWVLISAPEPRFLLPLGAILVAWVSVEASDLAPRIGVPDWARVATLGSMIALGALSQVEFRGYAYLWNRPDDGVSERARLQRVVDYLEAHGVRHVFSTNGLLQWQLMFYSREAVKARYTSASDRYRAYVTDVDRALAAGEPVAVVGYARPMRDLVQSARGHDALAIDDRYFVYLGPDRDLLASLGFRFAEEQRAAP
jgi:hypothetical protein